MVSHYPHVVTTPGEEQQPSEEQVAGSVMGRVRQIFCAMHGHDTMLTFEHDRMFLKCVSCGHESPGWELNETPPTISVHGDRRRQPLVSAGLVSERRIA